MTAVTTPVEVLSYANASAVASPAAETEVVAADQSVSGISTRPIRIRVSLNITLGAGATGYSVRVRRTNVGGSNVQSAVSVTQVAGNNDQFAHTWTSRADDMNKAGGQTYVVTVAQTGATGAGTVNAVDIEVYQ